MAMVPVVHVIGLGEGARPLFEAALPGREIRMLEDEAALRRAIGEIEVLFAFRPPRGVWAGATRLRLLQTIGAGVDSVLPAPDLPESVRITNARGVHGAQMGEYALAMMLAFAKRIPELLDAARARRWQPVGLHRLAGRACGILGLGAIGTAVAERARALGMRVVGTRRGARPVAVADAVCGPGETARVLRESDYVVVVLPLTPETRGLLDARLLGELRPEAVLVNMARGGIVDEAALASMLREGRLRGAALDVFDEEPLPGDSPLWDAPNVILSPHVAGTSSDYLQRVLEIFADNVARLESGRPLRNLVDRERGY